MQRRHLDHAGYLQRMAGEGFKPGFQGVQPPSMMRPRWLPSQASTCSVPASARGIDPVAQHQRKLEERTSQACVPASGTAPVHRRRQTAREIAGHGRPATGVRQGDGTCTASMSGLPMLSSCRVRASSWIEPGLPVPESWGAPYAPVRLSGRRVCRACCRRGSVANPARWRRLPTPPGCRCAGPGRGSAASAHPSPHIPPGGAGSGACRRRHR